jgi:PadR family transcriptional regulator, regulatory protein AphA
MPRAKTHLTPAEYAVLGVLRQRPAYGYELQRRFAPTSDLGLVCTIEPGMVYAILKSLAGLELIDGDWDSSQYPPKAVYAVTSQGDDTFRRWLHRPVGRMREVGLDFLLKLYFALDQDTAAALDLIDAQLDVCQEYRAAVSAEAAADVAGFRRIVLESKLAAVESTQRWLEQCRARFG